MTGEITRRGVLIGTGGLMAAAVDVGSSVARQPPEEAIHGALIVFHDYTDWALTHSTHLSRHRAPAAKVSSMTLVISDASPSLFADMSDVVLVRPSVLETLPPAVLVELTRNARTLVLSAHGNEAVARSERTDRSALWQRLAQFMALSTFPVNALLDLGGKGGAEQAIRAEIDGFRRAYAQYYRGTIGITCKCRPIAEK